MVVGDNGVLNQAQTAKRRTDIADFREAAGLVYVDRLAGKLAGDYSEVTMSDIVAGLEAQGYTVEQSRNVTKTVTGIEMPSVAGMRSDENTEITVTINIETIGDYYGVISGEYHLITLTSSGVIVAEEATEPSVVTERNTSRTNSNNCFK